MLVKINLIYRNFFHNKVVFSQEKKLYRFHANAISLLKLKNIFHNKVVSIYKIT